MSIPPPVATGSPSRRWLTSRIIIVTSVCVVVAVLGVWGLVSRSGPGSTADDKHTSTVLVPADGSLLVGEKPSVKVEQLLGSCTVGTQGAVTSDASATGSSCSYSAPGKLPVVQASTGERVALNATKSSKFTVAAVHIDRPSEPARMTVVGSELVLAGTDRGKYRVSILGSAGGAWQFELRVK
jgi:hypothetical protein